MVQDADLQLSLGADMVTYDAAAEEILRMVAGLVRMGDRVHLHTLDAVPLPIYVTDVDGFITYFNPACVDFAGRTPELFRDRWCVSWRLYKKNGDFLPHDRCAMAVAIQTKRAVRGITAVAERPDGVRVDFLPLPTPVISETGQLLGAVSMLIRATSHRESSAQDIRHDSETSQSDRVAQALAVFSVGEIREFLEEFESEIARMPPRILN